MIISLKQMLHFQTACHSFKDCLILHRRMSAVSSQQLFINYVPVNQWHHRCNADVLGNIAAVKIS